MRMPGYPNGVPSQFTTHVHPYPTRFHGPIYTRPVFGFPYAVNPQSVFKPDDFSEFYEKKQGTGTMSNGSLGSLQYNTGRGIFRPGGRGGGIFDGNIAGLGDMTDWITNPWGSAAAALTSSSSSDSSSSTPDTSAADASQAGQSAGAQAAQIVAAQTSGGSAGGSALPWGVYSPATASFQTALNKDLAANGYCTLTVDGKLGGGTCGAAKMLRDAGKATFPSTAAYCQKYTTPTKPPCGGGGGGGGGGSSTPLTAQQQAALVQSYGGGSNWKKYAVFGLGAAAVLGAAYYFEQRKKRK